MTAAVACDGWGDAPPQAEFLLAAGDSTFWVESTDDGIRVRGSPIFLANYGGRFYEVYVADDDRSYYDAVIIGQRIYRRDIVTGDSLLVLEDEAIAGLVRSHDRMHPGERQLSPDEPAHSDPEMFASSEIELLGMHGPFLSYEYRAEVERSGELFTASARRGVVDLRSGRRATAGELFGDSTAAWLAERGRALLTAALDSVLESGGMLAREVAGALADFEFRSTSFAVVNAGHRPMVEFLLPGESGRAGGHTLTLPAIPLHVQPAWWSNVTPSLPRVLGDSAAVWPRRAYTVVVRYSASRDSALLAIADSAGGEWRDATVPMPAHRIYWLDSPAPDSVTRAALARAFDEAALYSGEARIALAGTP
ncbi:MAG: hypothetical protein ACRENI_00455 [Gemmatimonadaceae bacterium]